MAQRVVQDLVSRFIDENIRNRSNATFQTTEFMKDEMDDAKKELDAAEDKLAAYRMQNNGRLPDQVDSNMRQLTALQSQAGYLSARISAVNQEKLQWNPTSGFSRISWRILARMRRSCRTRPIIRAGTARCRARFKHVARPTDVAAAAL